MLIKQNELEQLVDMARAIAMGNKQIITFSIEQVERDEAEEFQLVVSRLLTVGDVEGCDITSNRDDDDFVDALVWFAGDGYSI